MNVSLVQPSSDRLNRLSGIPLDIILHHLDLATFTNLRLTSRQLSTNTIHSRFFRSAKTDVSLASLQSLADRPAEATVLTRQKWSGFDKDELRRDTENYRRHVEDLCERNVACTNEEVQEAQRDLAWLKTRIEQDTNTDVSKVTDLLSSIFINATNLRAITLDACIIAGLTKTCQPAEHHKWYRSASQNSSWPSVWSAASQTFRIITSAISRSRIQLEKLQIFPGTPLCSVQLRHVEDHLRTLDSDGFSDACKSIQSFELSFSTLRNIEGTSLGKAECLFRDAFAARSAYRRNRHLESDAEDFTGVATILTKMSNLASLDLHLYHLDHIILPRYTKVFSRISQSVSLGCLKDLSLRGLPLRPDDIIHFLTNHPTITTVCLDGVFLVGGSWSTVFSCIESMPALESLHLNSLSTEHHHITNLDPVELNSDVDLEDREKWVPCGDGHILYNRIMCRKEICQGLDFRPQPGPRNIWSDDTLAYFDRIQYESGPPSHSWVWDPLNENM
ncbi:f-box domain protein [Fusarium subglutinans]|uniref:F-box domain protein n=1 Tax=Gibberella subglutinans TaxID=42677 RepID=A0A8H5P2C9_GIBSU|nr:f-box domain protein [Fusarium subglutinans]KAF5588336.1 f-box domain protein [Fusarium subglutinans]